MIRTRLDRLCAGWRRWPSFPARMIRGRRMLCGREWRREFFLGGEMAENHRLRDASRVGNFLGGGAAKARLEKS